MTPIPAFPQIQGRDLEEGARRQGAAAPERASGVMESTHKFNMESTHKFNKEAAPVRWAGMTPSGSPKSKSGIWRREGRREGRRGGDGSWKVVSCCKHYLTITVNKNKVVLKGYYG